MPADPKWVFTCATGRSIGNDPFEAGKQIPKCNSGAGSWIQINQWTEEDIRALAAEEGTIGDFDVNQLTAQDLLAPWGAGFTVMATGLVIVLACRALLRALR